MYIVHVHSYSPFCIELTKKQLTLQDDNINAYSFGSAIPNLEISWSAKGSVESKSLGI